MRFCLFRARLVLGTGRDRGWDGPAGRLANCAGAISGSGLLHPTGESDRLAELGAQTGLGCLGLQGLELLLDLGRADIALVEGPRVAEATGVGALGGVGVVELLPALSKSPNV